MSKTYRPGDGVFVQRLTDGESVLLHEEDQIYYGLNWTGTEMWEALVDAGTVGPALERLEETLEVDPDQLRSDLEGLIDRLVDAGLLVVDDE